MHYYNEIDPYAAEWLRNLIAGGHLPAGDVDERSIVDAQPDDLAGYTQCHFFAGIGGWPYALRLAGWFDDRPVWTGSCPCQPLSSAGQRKGHADERHLWPAFYRLISERRPPTIFGEQVASKDGREWLAAVRPDLEHVGYACGAADLPAAGVGAPHIRQRLWFVADTDGDGREPGQPSATAARYGDTAEPDGGNGLLGDADGRRRVEAGRDIAADPEVACDGEAGRGRGAGPHGPWSDLEWLRCTDGGFRPTQPGLFPLADGVPARVGRLRAYGNAIVPQVAAEFVMAFMECRP